jgi:hypothetical protein
MQAGIVGSFPALNARPQSQLDEWLHRITEELAAWDRANPDRPAAPYAVNQIVHRSNDRLQQDMATCAKWKVPIVITSLGALVEVNQAVHGWGGIALHDIIDDRFARKAVEKGADGLIAGRSGRRRPCRAALALCARPGDPHLVRGAADPVRRDRDRTRDPRRPGDGRGPRLYRLAFHRDRRSQRNR